MGKVLIDPKTEGQTVIYTYSVEWTYSSIDWADRWQVYLLMLDNQIHWFSIVNSLMIVLFLTGMVAMIMIRTLRADLRKYNMPLDQEDIQEETGWKLVHGDVFRPPKWRMFLSVLCGTGVQVFAMYLITMRTFRSRSTWLIPVVFAILGFLSPANRGGLLMAVPVLFVLMGCAQDSCKSLLILWQRVRRLLLCNHVQAHGRTTVEAQYVDDGLPAAWRRFRHRDLPELLLGL